MRSRNYMKEEHTSPETNSGTLTSLVIKRLPLRERSYLAYMFMELLQLETRDLNVLLMKIERHKAQLKSRGIPRDLISIHFLRNRISDVGLSRSNRKWVGKLIEIMLSIEK